MLLLFAYDVIDWNNLKIKLRGIYAVSAFKPLKPFVNPFQLLGQRVFVFFKHFNFFFDVHQRHRGLHAHLHAHSWLMMPVVVVTMIPATTAATPTTAPLSI